MMRRIKLTVEYDGTDFAGFQTQAPGTRTVQESLTKAISQITSGKVIVHGAGRTDSGVHALGQVAHFETASVLPVERIERGLNALLPRDVSVREACEVDGDFHARFSAKRRTYLYLTLNRSARSAIWDRYSLHEPAALNADAMRQAARSLVGTHDFRAFANAGGEPGSTTVRRLERLSVRRARGGESIVIVAAANAFLRSMVRNLVGALLDVGRGSIGPDEPAVFLVKRDRTQNPCATAPPRGLCLYRIDYAAKVDGVGLDEPVGPTDEEG
jgi:tRNA pseudouridine38-40 synthase